MPFPSTLTTFTNPNATDTLDSPSHSSIHGNANDAIKQIERVIGREGGADASALGTIIGDLRSASSDGGGHVQTAVLGGTGQTTFTKGDILVATNASTLSKLAVGTDNQILLASSVTSSGIKWADDSTPKIKSSVTTLNVTNSTSETSVVSVTIPGSTLGVDNAARVKLFVNQLKVSSNNDVLTIKGHYGTTSIATLTFASVAAQFAGEIQMNLLGAGNVSSQKGIVHTNLYVWNQAVSSNVSLNRFAYGTSEEDSDTAKTIGITAKWNNASIDNDFESQGFTVEKIT